jgi:hypothetical protein
VRLVYLVPGILLTVFVLAQYRCGTVFTLRTHLPFNDWNRDSKQLWCRREDDTAVFWLYLAIESLAAIVHLVLGVLQASA